MKVLHAYVSGYVQGVFFRAETRALARRLGLAGWVRNLADSRLEVFAQGSGEAVDELEGWLHRGPSGARVEQVQVDRPSVDPSLTGFSVR